MSIADSVRLRRTNDRYLKMSLTEGDSITKIPGDDGKTLIIERINGFSNFKVVTNEVAATISTDLSSKKNKLSDKKQVDIIGFRVDTYSPFVNHEREIVTYNRPQVTSELSASNETVTKIEKASRVNGTKMKEGVKVANTKRIQPAKNKQNVELKETKTKRKPAARGQNGSVKNIKTKLLKVTTKRITRGSRNNQYQNKETPKDENKASGVKVKGKRGNTQLNRGS